jgi:hypothetical protein
MGNRIDIGSPVQDAVVQSSVVQNLKGCSLLGGVHGIHPTWDMQGTISGSIPNPIVWECDPNQGHWDCESSGLCGFRV